jgi:membrane protease YdiL (CAAX protease family)
MALIWPVMAALGEEIGWRGVLLPQLEAGLGLVPAALVIGVVWGVWHLPADYIALKGYGDWFWPAFLVNGPIVLTGHSLIMAWLHRQSGGNLGVAVLYHWSITATAIAVPAAGTEGASGVLAAGIGAMLVWLAAGALWLPRRKPNPQG